MRFTGIVAATALAVTLSVTSALAEDPLTGALRAAWSKNYDEARTLAKQVKDPAARDVVTWTLLRATQGELNDYQNFLDRNPDWPGLPLLMKRGEINITRNAAPQDVLRFFETHAPQTGVGALRLAAAQKAIGERAKSHATITDAWSSIPMSADEQNAFVERHFRIIAPHHQERLDNLLWDGNFTSARRMFPLVGEDWRKLSEARMALRNLDKGVDGKIEAVPNSLRNNAGLSYERFLWRARKGRPESALELLSSRSASAEALGQPEEWANRRRSMARQLMRDGRNKEAYWISANHHLEGGSSFSDLEWLSGFIALRKMNDPEKALGHFRRFRNAVQSPISLGRAGYWEGRALEALGRDDDAQAAYAFGAEYQTSFYGQLAAERGGIPTDPALLGREDYPDWRNASFLESTVLQAALELHKAGQKTLAERFMVHLCESLTPTEMGQLADIAFELGEPHVALMIAKFAARRGHTLQRAYHPVTDIVRQTLPVEDALTLAIARRESEFDPAVVSPAGARGLMQLMPRTGKAMAEKRGEPFSERRLTADPAFNARLGTTYLAELIDDFGPNLPLVAGGYNAGPGRSYTWIKRYGDPRSSDVDVVDWIEHVPFRETRNYIMRVTESYVVYKLRLSDEVQPMDITNLLKAR